MFSFENYEVGPNFFIFQEHWIGNVSYFFKEKSFRKFHFFSPSSRFSLIPHLSKKLKQKIFEKKRERESLEPDCNFSFRRNRQLYQIQVNGQFTKISKLFSSSYFED